MRNLALFLLLLLVSCGSQRLPTATIIVGAQPVLVEIASTPQTRAEGLMNRDELTANTGMLFIFPDNRTRSFWMKNTRIPLSIAYINSDLEIVRISDMKPFSTDRVPSLYPARYALEMNRGWFESNDIAKGSLISDLPNIEPK
jgi:uncharacterized membrane protein (UPF0127 family)